jgi:chemotaxis response regulator CheB
LHQTEHQLHEVHAAVLYENEKFAEPLKAAVAAAGAGLTGEYRLSELKPEELSALRADVLVVNLERILEKRAGLMDAVLAAAETRRLVFNDADAFTKLKRTDMARWARHLGAKIMGTSNRLPPPPVRNQNDDDDLVELEPSGPENYELWILGASIGGPEALRMFLAELDSDIGVAFILVQHIGKEFIQLMTGQLDQVSSLPVRRARDGDELRPGHVLVVPSGKQMFINKRHRIQLEDLPEGSRYSPCIDQVLESVLESFGADAHAIIFSGMANDGIEGATKMMERGCEVWVQSPETCVVASMVDGSIKAGGVKFTGAPADLAAKINQRSQEQAAAMESQR